MAYHDNYLPLTIWTHLENVLSDEQHNAIFKCETSKISSFYPYKWFKDGIHIGPNTRILTKIDGYNFILEITSVSVIDEGVYSIQIIDGTNVLHSFANLYVGSTLNAQKTNSEVLYMKPTLNRHVIEKRMKNAHVNLGSVIKLAVTFTEDAVGDYLWYKSNKQIISTKRTIILSSNRSTILSIMSAKKEDSGIYHVVSNTRYGIASSFASLFVSKLAISRNINPYIVEGLPKKVNKCEGQETRLVVKAVYDRSTNVQWYHDRNLIISNDEIIMENYGYKIITLRLLNPRSVNSGEYCLRLSNDISGRTVTTNCQVNIRQTSEETICNVITPLKRTVSCFGNRVLLSCSFDLPDPQYHFVVWYIGLVKVERSNYRFNVFNSGGDFFLFIKQVEPSMAGEIICELYRNLPRILINKTTSHFSIVPRPFIEDEIKKRRGIVKQLMFKYPATNLVICCTNKMIENYNHDATSSHNVNLATEKTQGVLIITFCRFSCNSFFLDVYDPENQFSGTELVVNETRERTHSLLIEWRGNNTPKNGSKWYEIDFYKSGQEFVQAGLTSSPRFELIDPPAEIVLLIKITTRNTYNIGREITDRLYPARNELNNSKEICELQDVEAFTSQYTLTNNILGCGAFGSVELVHDKEHRYYAAKTIITLSRRKREVARREFEIIKDMGHPKVLELVGCFKSNDSFVLVTEYLWGGELFDRVIEEYHIQEIDVLFYVRQICEGVVFLHQNNIGHLDLKPENIVCLSPNSRQIKIIDFGLARVLLHDVPLTKVYGTMDYVAPEMVNYDRITLACDMWSLGVITYMLLSGVAPFNGDNCEEQSDNITRGEYNYNNPAFNKVSDLAKKFIDSLLKLLPETRLNAAELLKHPWICEEPPDRSRSGHLKRTQENLKKYITTYKAKWQKAGRAVIAAHRLYTQVELQSASSSTNTNIQKCSYSQTP